MIKLYEAFQQWQSCGAIFLYSDPHFNDPEMQYIRKNYIGDDEQVKRINSKVGKNDTLIILGDVGDVNFVKKLRGYKVLIMGNHDQGASNYKRIEHILLDCEVEEEKEALEKGYRKMKSSIVCDTGYYYYKDNRLFDEVYEGPLFIAPKILLTHEPVEFPYALNIHGHDHSKWGFDDKYHLNVCAEHINYTPVSLKSVIESGRLKDIDDIHRITIDKATEKSEKKQKNE